MSDKVKIGAGLAFFLVLATFPIWYALGAAGNASPPDLELPGDGSQCVEDAQWMAAHHVDLLNQWREAVVREGESQYISSSGETHLMSLTGTCMKCHGNRETFCHRCHSFANVRLRCWDCHLESKGN